MAAPRILVTGHQGYVGPIAVAELKKAGYAVRGIDTGYFREGLFKPETEADENLPLDLRDITAEHLQGVEGVVHLAGLSNDPLGALDPALTDSINTQASQHMADLARQAGVKRFVFASSCSVYGAAAQHDTPLDEQAPCNPVSAYAVSKLTMEKYLASLANDKFSPVSLRFATAYGLSPHLRLDIVLNNLMAHAYLTGTVKVLSDGTPWRPLVHVRDMVGAIIACLRAPRERIQAQSFNIGRNDGNYQVKDIAEAVTKKIKGAKLEITGETGGDPRSYRVDFNKALKALSDFQPQWTIEKGCTELLEAFERYKLPKDALQNPRFIRLQQLRRWREENKLRPDLRWAT